jgi:hypothetical protein
VESGYGGTRPSPHIEQGIVFGDDPRVGHQFWFHPHVSSAVRAQGASFAVVTQVPIELPDTLQRIGAQLVIAPESIQGAYAVVVRPDRYVAAVAYDANQLSRVSELLFASML